MNNGKISRLSASEPIAKSIGGAPRRGEIIQPEFSGLRAIPLDPFDAVSFTSALPPPPPPLSPPPLSFLTSCLVAYVSQPDANLRSETGWKYQTGIATQSKLLYFLPCVLSSRHFAVTVARGARAFPPREKNSCCI